MCIKPPFHSKKCVNGLECFRLTFSDANKWFNHLLMPIVIEEFSKIWIPLIDLTSELFYPARYQL